MQETNRKLTAFYAASGHMFMHMFAAFYFVIVLALEEDWNFSYSELIELWLLGSLLVGLGAIPAGWLSDRWSRSGMIAIMFIGLGLSSIACGLSDIKLSLFINLSVLGLFCSIYHPAGISWVVNTANQTGRALGINNIFGGVGIGLGAAVSGLIIEWYNWKAAFFFPGILSMVLGCLLIWHIKTNKVSLQNVVSEKFSKKPENSNYLKIAIIMLTSIACMAFVFQVLQTSLPKVIDIRLSESLNLDPSTIGLSVSAIYIVSGMMNYVGGYLADKYSEKLIYVIGILLQSILLFLLANISTYIFIIFALMTVASNSSILPAENILLARFSPVKYQSLVYGIKFIVSFAIAPLAVLIISKTYEVTNEFFYLYLLCGFLMAMLFVIVIRLPTKAYS